VPWFSCGCWSWIAHCFFWFSRHACMNPDLDAHEQVQNDLIEHRQRVKCHSWVVSPSWSSLTSSYWISCMFYLYSQILLAPIRIYLCV
jgi:hypothetical protein